MTLEHAGGILLTLFPRKMRGMRKKKHEMFEFFLNVFIEFSDQKKL